MSRFLARPRWEPVIVIDRSPKRRRTSNDVIAMVIAGTFLLAMLMYAITEVFPCH